MGTSPSQRSLEYLRRLGWPHVQSVEKWIPQARRRKDLFKFADILAMHPEWGHLYVQATSGNNAAARLSKMRQVATKEVEHAIRSGARVEIHGWRKLKGRGRRKWFPRIIKVGLDELYEMDKNDWLLVEKYMQETWNEFPGMDQEVGDFIVKAYLSQYPPRICIDVCGQAGKGRAEPDFTQAERAEAATIATDICRDVLRDKSNLKLVKAPRVGRFTLSFALRPKNYEEVARVRKSQSRV